MKGIKKGLAILLVLCTLLSMVVMTGAGTADTSQDTAAAQSANDDFYKIVHLDCGRKYFTKDWIIALINEMSAAGYNQLELAFGNDGLRFLLDDMSFEANGTTYDHTTVVSKVEQGNIAQNSSGVDRWLTQTEMDEIITAANAKGIQIVPLLNLPGHANAILDIFDDEYNASGSQNTFDVTNAEGLKAATAIFKKYVDYFDARGCKFFNFGADEYANDASSGSFSFSRLNAAGYQSFVSFINELADYIVGKGMTPRAFNDGLYYGNWTNVTINTAIQCCYWSSGWSGYNVASASTIANEGHDMINTHGDYYYVLKDGKIQNPANAALEFSNISFMGGDISDPAGSMFCIWCDDPNVATEQEIAANVRMTLRMMAASMNNTTEYSGADVIVPYGFNADGSINGGAAVDPTPDVTQEKTITVSKGGTATDTIEGGDYSSSIDNSELNTSIAGVSAAHESVAGEKSIKKVTAIESGKQYLILNTRADKLLTDNRPEKTNYLSLNGTLSADSEELWTITSKGSGYTVQNSTGQYLTIDNGTASTSSKSATLAMSYQNGTWTISQNSYYLNDYQGERKYAAGWKDNTAATDAGSQWRIYEIVTTDPVDATTVTFTGNAVGTTYVTVGNTRYTINVIAENLDAVTPLTVEYWITNGRPTDSNGATSYSVSAAASGVYSEDGVEVSTFIPATAVKDGRTLEFWRCRLLNKNLSNSSTNGTEEQTAQSGDDETLNGTVFTKVRYWNGKWQVFTTEWVTVETNHQLVAYYMEVVSIDNSNGESELHVNAADWGTKGDGTGNWGYTPERDRCSVSIQIVYEDGTTNPSSNTATDLKSKTFVYGYWSGGRGLGTMIFNGQQNYQIYKVTAETGDMASTTSGNYVTVTGFTWDDNEETVWEGDATQSVSIGNPARNPSYESPLDNLTWNTSSYNQNNAILIRVYVRTVATKSALTVHYIDNTASTNTEFYNYNIAVEEGTTFSTGFALGTEKNTLVNNTVENYNGVTQTVTADLSKMSEIGAQYRYSDYDCVKVERSADGKDVYLYYTFNNAHSFVVDFGLPMEIGASKISANLSTLTGASVSRAEFGTAVITDGKLIYTPTKVLTGVESLTLTIKEDGSTESASHQIYIYPATTVYYEESFVTYDGGAISGSPNAGNQAAEVAGKHDNNYGYDDAYKSAVGDSNGTIATLLDGAEGTFTFTGTGVDIYARCTTETGKVVVAVYKQNEDNTETFTNFLQVNTVMKDGKTAATTNQEVTAYNVPIVSLTGLAYGNYRVELQEVQTRDESNAKVHWPVYIDGFRVHGTLDVETTTAYQDDGEANPTFVELRNAVLAGLDVADIKEGQYADQIAENAMSQVYAEDEAGKGAVVFTKESTNSTVDDYDVQDLLDNGPKNEFYLFPDQTVVFKIEDGYTNPQIGLKALNGEVKYTINNESKTLTTSTDMFYSIDSGTITITNNGAGILSITEIKAFAGVANGQAMFAALSEADLMPALLSMGFESEPVEAAATLNITVQAGGETLTTTLTATGTEGERHTFTAAEIQAAVEELELPEGYTLDGVTFEDVTVTCGEASDASFTAAESPAPTPVSPLQKIIQIAVKIIKKIVSWF